MARKLPTEQSLDGPSNIDLERVQDELVKMKKAGVGLSISSFTRPEEPDGEEIGAVVHVQGVENTRQLLEAVKKVAEEISKESK